MSKKGSDQDDEQGASDHDGPIIGSDGARAGDAFGSDGDPTNETNGG